MKRYQYRVVSAPSKTLISQCLHGTGPGFALRIQSLINKLGAEGWEYVSADTLPAQERRGLASKATIVQNFLVFRRALGGIDSAQVSDSEEEILLECDPEDADVLWERLGWTAHPLRLTAANLSTRPRGARLPEPEPEPEGV